MGLLGEFLTVLNLGLTQAGDFDIVVDILKQLGECSRFSLALGFLSKDEKKAVRDMYWSPRLLWLVLFSFLVSGTV
jgi:hypothetical protein